MTLILFCTQAPNPLTTELHHQGHTVYEAIAISEVYALADQHPQAQTSSQPTSTPNAPKPSSTITQPCT
jgi:hypothetical protein